MPKYKVIVVRTVLETLDLEVEAEDEEEADKKAFNMAIVTDASKWDCDTTDYQIEIQEA